MKSKIRKTILAIVFCCLCGGISAQNIKIFFPQFIGKEYVFILNQGVKRDTVQSGVVGETGFVSVELKIPETYKDYVGIGSWLTTDGKGVNFIVNNENFSVTCLDSVPSTNNISYEGSKENNLMKRYETELFTLYQKIDSVFKAENIANNQGNMPPSFLKAMKSIGEEYSVIQKELAAETSYAAFFWRTLNYIRGLGNRMYYKPDDEKDYFSDLTHYLTDEVNIEYLYSSGLWHPAVTTTFNIPGEKTVWGENMVKMLKRTQSQRIFEVLSTDVIVICEQYGWADAEQIILTYLETSGRLPADPGNFVNRAILQSKVKIGDQAAAIEGEIPKNAILIFYESGCTHCQHQLAEIIEHYPKMVEKGIRVISISTDESKDVFEYHSNNFPWTDKLCDFKGFKGENLKNYGVIGTPTIYFIDENGIIRDRQARIDAIKALNLH